MHYDVPLSDRYSSELLWLGNPRTWVGWIRKNWFLWTFMIVFVVMSHVFGDFFTGNFDDLSFYRSSAYLTAAEATASSRGSDAVPARGMSPRAGGGEAKRSRPLTRSPDHPLVSQLRDHLEEHTSELPPYVYERYRFRLSGRSNFSVPWRHYILLNGFVRLLELFPLSSAYQSVFVAKGAVHLVSVFIVCLAFGILFKHDQRILQISLLMSLVPTLFFFPVQMGLLFPFQIRTDLESSWLSSAVGGTALTFFFSSFLFWFDMGNSEMTRSRRITVALMLAVLSVLTHVGMGLLWLLTTLLFVLVYSLLKLNPRELVCRLKFRRFLVLFNGLVVLVAISKLVAIHFILRDPERYYFFGLAGNGTDMDLMENVLILTSWLLGVNLLAHGWLRLRTSERENNSLSRAGDIFFAYLIPSAVFGIGLNAFHPDKAVSYGSLYLPTAACSRMIVLPHLLWWMLFGVWLYSSRGEHSRRVIETAALSLLLVLSVTSILRFALLGHKSQVMSKIFDPTLLNIRSRDLLELSGKEAYADEALYFQAIANELREEGAKRT